MLKEGVVQVNIKATCKTDISQRPFDRICHPQHCPSFKGLWILLCEIDMNNLQAKMLLALMRKKIAMPLIESHMEVQEPQT